MYTILIIVTPTSEIFNFYKRTEDPLVFELEVEASSSEDALSKGTKRFRELPFCADAVLERVEATPVLEIKFENLLPPRCLADWISLLANSQ